MTQRDRLPDQVLVVLATLPRRDEDRSPAVILDEREVRDVQLEEPRQLVQQNLRDPGGAVGVEQLVRKAADFGALAIAARSLLFSLARGPGSGDESGEIAPVTGDRDERHGEKENADECNQRMTGRRLLGDQRLDAHDRCGEPHAWEDQRRGKPDLPRPTTLSPQCRGHRQAHGQIQRRENEQRHRIEQHRLGLCVHWATPMIELATSL